MWSARSLEHPLAPGGVEKQGGARNVGPGGENQRPQEGGGHRDEEGIPWSPVLPLGDVI